jgi:RNA polymerase sigma-70 factor (ECF subfamily)
MDDIEWLAGRFEEQRPHLRAVAYRMLGSVSEAEDAVQDAWTRVARADTDQVENLGGWLTTVVARVCLNMLRSRNVRRAESLDGHLPDPIVQPEGYVDPADEALLADSVGLALQVVIDTLTPEERLAFVLHDMFDLPFNEIAPLMGRTPEATRQLASRARRRVKGGEIQQAERDRGRQRLVVDAFFAAARAGRFDDLVALLDSNVVLRADFGPSRPDHSTVLRGADQVAGQARLGSRLNAEIHPALVNGAAGVVITTRGRPFAVMAFTVAAGKITEIDVIGDQDRVASLSSAVLADVDLS